MKPIQASNQPNPKIISLTKPKQKIRHPQTIPPSPLKSPIGQVEILDQHSVKGAERLRADEVVPNLDKAPPEDAGMMPWWRSEMWCGRHKSIYRCHVFCTDVFFCFFKGNLICKERKSDLQIMFLGLYAVFFLCDVGVISTMFFFEYMVDHAPWWHVVDVKWFWLGCINWYPSSECIHWKFNGWNTVMEVWKMIFPLQMGDF